MTMNRLHSLLACTALALLAACGPGVGGTGTGNAYPPEVFGATSTALCASPLVASLNCSSVGSPSGTALTLLADDSARRIARVEGDRIEFEAACDGLDFVGDWGTLGNQSRFWGALTRASAVIPASAVVLLQPDGSLSFELRDTIGGLLYGPVVLRRVGTLPMVTCT